MQDLQVKKCYNCGNLKCPYPSDEEFAEKAKDRTWLADMDCWVPITDEEGTMSAPTPAFYCEYCKTKREAEKTANKLKRAGYLSIEIEPAGSYRSAGYLVKGKLFRY